MSGVFSPTRAKIKERTLRTDKWWLQPLATFGVLISFVVYATFRAFENANYYVDHLISPFYSPCLSQACVPEATMLGFTPVSAQIFNFALSPALIIQNSHRYFFYAGLLLNVILSYDAIISFKNPEGEWGHMSVGSLVLVVSSTLLWFYSMSCHSCRHTIGGRLKNFSKHPIRYKLWSWASVLNHSHQQFAWFSLAAVAFADIYVRQVATGAWTNFYFF